VSGGSNAFSRTLIERSGYADDAFTALYDRARPTPPAALLQILVVNSPETSVVKA
jgi:hypothetical protein